MSSLAPIGSGQTGVKLPASQRVGFEPFKILRQQLIAVASAAPATGTTVTRVARVITPASELQVAIGLAFEPAAGQVVADYQSAAWTLTAMRSGAGGGKEARYHKILDATALPALTNHAGIIPDIEVSAALTIPLDGAAAGIPGEWVLEVSWGGAIHLCPEDREFLYAMCGIKAPTARVGLLIP